MCQEASAPLAFLPGACASWSFSKSKRASWCWVATEAARRHPHLHPTSIQQSLPAQKGTIRQPAKQMRFPYIRQTLITFPMLSLFLCRVLPQPEPKKLGWGWGGHLGEGSECSLQGLPSFSSAYRGRRSFRLGRLIWCVCKRHYRWKGFRRCLASINPICVLTHFKRACRCTHEMRETPR